MNNLHKRQLTCDGIKYVCETLKRGGPLASAVNISSIGEAWTYLPETSKVVPLDYSEGGVFNPDEAFEAEQTVSALLFNFLHQSSSNVALFEDQSFRMNDPAVADDKFIFECEGVLYHYRSQSHGGRGDELQDAMGVASQYPTIILLASARRELPQQVAIPFTRAQEFIKDVRHVIVGSYDEEGFIVWSRNKSELL